MTIESVSRLPTPCGLPRMEKQVRNVLVLSCTQATLQITGATIATITGLAGFALATDKSFATVPLTCYVIGSGITLMGIYTAFGKYYRFAAADAASYTFRAKAISLTLAGGIAGGIVGPEMAKRTVDLFADYLYLCSYLSLLFLFLLAMLVLQPLSIPKLSDHDLKDSGRPLGAIMRQPVFVVAVLASMLSYGIMNLFMTSTPLAMRAHDHPFHDAAFVIEWHMI